MSLYLLEGVDNFISSPPTDVCPVLDQFLDVTLSATQSISILITKNKTTPVFATLHCLTHGATLVRINTPEKQAYLARVLTTCPGITDTDYWTEGTNIQALNKLDQSSWIFADLSNMPMGDSYWAIGAPYSPIIDNCVRMQKNNGYKWKDSGCSQKYGYICEK